MYSPRRIGWMVIGAIMVVMLAACSGNSNKAPEPKGPVQDQPQNQMQNQPQNEAEGNTPDNSAPNQEPSEIPEEGTPPTALEAASTVIRALKSGNMNTVSNWADVEEGVRFSPYGNVDQEKDLVFSRDELKGLMKDTTKRIWREFPGTGDKIELTYAEYHERFVYDADFIKEAKISENEGNGPEKISNLYDVYPKDQYDFVEYYIEASDPDDAESKDWRTLRLVFKAFGEDHSLVGIIHDQWTP